MGSRSSFSWENKGVEFGEDGDTEIHVLQASPTMMDRSPRAPVFLSRAILAMALKAASFTLSSH